MGWAVAGPILASAAGAGISSAGGKKASRNSAPQIPSVFQRPVGAASQVLTRDIYHGIPGYTGQLSANFNPLQEGGIQQISALLGQGQSGLDSALKTITGAAETGLSPSDIDLALQTTNPLFEYQKERSLSQLRESQAQGGRYFSSGALGQESDLLRGLEAQRTNDILPLAMNLANYRLGAAENLPAFLAGSMGLGQAAFQVGSQQQGIEQQGLDRLLQEFLRTRPEAAISSLAGLMGGTPFYNPVVPPNAAQIFGSGLAGLAGSPGFQSALAGAYQPRMPTTGVQMQSFAQQYPPGGGFNFVFNPATGQYEIH